jgi:hypothetical protein
MRPEEFIRQSLVNQMVNDYHFPRELLGIEREISSFPHLKGVKVPKRRFDLVCFSTKISMKYPLYPLLLVECKAIPLSMNALEQVLGYNYYVDASFVAIANGEGLLIADQNGEIVRDGLIPYGELVSMAVAAREKSVPCI